MSDAVLVTGAFGLVGTATVRPYLRSGLPLSRKETRAGSGASGSAACVRSHVSGRYRSRASTPREIDAGCSDAG